MANAIAAEAGTAITAPHRTVLERLRNYPQVTPTPANVQPVACRVADFAVRRVLPQQLDRAGQTEATARLRALSPIRTPAATREAKRVLRDIGDLVNPTDLQAIINLLNIPEEDEPQPEQIISVIATLVVIIVVVGGIEIYGRMTETGADSSGGDTSNDESSTGDDSESGNRAGEEESTDGK